MQSGSPICAFELMLLQIVHSGSHREKTHGTLLRGRIMRTKQWQCHLPLPAVFGVRDSDDI